MARPCKSAKVITGKLGNDNVNIRAEQEEVLKGSSAELSPPAYLNKKQKQLYKFIVSELKNAGILCGLDTYILETCVIAIDRLQAIEKQINDDFELVKDKGLLSAKDKYTKDLYRCCNELSLSPQARAKLANINVKVEQDKADPLLELMSNG